MVALVALLAIVALLVPRGSGRHDSGSVLASSATPPSALERSRQGRGEQQRAIDRVLDYTAFVREGRPLKREVALTFDDGPGPYTAPILRILRRHDAPATFFNVGLMLDSFHRLTSEELDQGHAVGAHTFDHAKMGELPPRSQEAQLTRLDYAMSAHHLPDPRLFRPPFGSYDSATIDLLRERGMLMVLWSTDTGDYLNPGADVIAERALAGAKPGAVILMHDAGGDRTQTIEALPKILAGLEKRHLTPVTVPELLADDPPARDQQLGDISDQEISTESAATAPPPVVGATP